MPASASRVHFFEKSIGSAGSGAGQLQLRATVEGAAGSGVAVNASNHLVYVADTENHRVDEFQASGVFVRAWGWGVGGGSAFETCTASCNAGISGSEPGEFAAPVFVAVDDSGGASQGDVYVEDAADNVVTKFTAEGALIGTWGNGGALETPNGQLKGAPIGTGGTVEAFSALAGIAVDSSGTLDVLEKENAEGVHVMFEFAQDGSLTGSFETPRGSQPFGLAVEHAGNFFKANGNGTVEEFGASGADVGQATKKEDTVAELATTGLAADAASGDLYVDTGAEIERYAFNGGGEIEEAGGAKCPVQPNPELLPAFGCGPTEAFGASHLSTGAGLAVDSAATVYAADAAAGHIDVFPLEPLTVPQIQGETVSQVTDDSATLEAEINPRSLAGEQDTEYHFEYGPCLGALSTCPESEYPSKTSAESLPPDFEAHPVSVRVAGLKPGTLYHFRVVATNKQGTSQNEHTFTTQGTAAFALPDGRQWEMVSPADMHGALVKALDVPGFGAGAVTQAAVGGGALTYVTETPTESSPAGNVDSAQVLSTRGAGGWSSQDIAVPHTEPTTTSASEGQELRFFSEDLSQAVVQPFGGFVPCRSAEGVEQPCISPAASEQTPFLRNDVTAAYTPLVTGCPAAPAHCEPAVEEHADVPPGTVFGSANGHSCPPSVVCGPEFKGATADLSHVILLSGVALTQTAIPNEGLYEWSAGLPASRQLQLVSVLPANASKEELPASGPRLGLNDGGNGGRGAISGDGSRVFFSSGGHLYMRDTVAGKTIQIDAPEAGCLKEETCGGGHVEAEFQFASSDGSRVFFADTQKLTADGKEYPEPRTENATGADLYVCEVREGGCALKDLAPSGAVLGSLVGASEDGATVYFVANGVLASGAVGGSCVNRPPNDLPTQTCNLYVEHREAGGWGSARLVAVLSGGDAPDWRPEVLGLTARVSPDGGWLAFMSQRSLTGYDNRDAVSGQRDEEVFLYDAARDRVVCASCDPSGARPHGVEYGGSISNLPLAGGGGRVWSTQTWLAANVPGWTHYEVGDALVQPRYLSDSGRLFFNSSDALVPKDVNGIEDVYEYEPRGVPAGERACSPSAASGGVVYVEGAAGEAGAGCVGLVSSGASREESAFMEASGDGGDVFFVSTARLSPLDSEGGLTVYDAHECTTASPCVAPPPPPPPACSTEASCRAAASPQPSIFGAPASATFSGPGNVVSPPPRKKTAAEVRAEKLAKALHACRRFKKHSKRARCEKVAHRRYAVKAARHARRAGDGGRAGR
jgi:NHL repeat-containing protein/WD40 repeat protein